MKWEDGRIRFDSIKCINCDLCVKACPTKIKRSEREKMFTGHCIDVVYVQQLAERCYYNKIIENGKENTKVAYIVDFVRSHVQLNALKST